MTYHDWTTAERRYVARAWSMGASAHQIARRLGVSEEAVRTVAVRARAQRTHRPMHEVDRGQHSPRVWALEWILVQGAVRGAEPRRLVDEAIRLVRQGVV